jgi:cell division septation protein DedD
MWLLLPGRTGFTVTPGPAVSAAAAAVAAPGSGRSSPAGPGSPAGPAPGSSATAATVTAEKPAALLQIGLFSREANAGVMAERLRNAGFKPSVGRRTVNGIEYRAVTVEPGQDMGQTVLRLRDAGFEAFPVY